MAAAAARVSIPAAVRRTIQNIKEIAGGHTDEEVYAVLRECNMDPNETTDRLLSQGAFHEVRRKRDKKKENSKESTDARWRAGMQGRGGKGGWGNSSRQPSNSTDLTGRNAPVEKEIEVNPNVDKCSSSLPVNPNTDTKMCTSISSLSGGQSNGSSEPVVSMEKNSLVMGQLQISDSKGISDLERTPEKLVMALGPDVRLSLIQSTPSISGECIPASDPELTPPPESHSHGETGSTKHALATQLAAREKVVSNDVSTALQGTSRPSGSSSIAVPSGSSRPSSSCSSRAQQLIGVQKVVPNKEWKPKSTNKPAHAENVICDKVLSLETISQSILASDSIHKEDTTSGVDKKQSDSHLSDRQHVIIPDHLQVAESEKYGLSFGSFGACFEKATSVSKDSESEKCSTPHCESSQDADEAVDEPVASHQGVSSTVEMAAEPDLQQLPVETADNILPQKVDSSSSTPEAAESDQSNDPVASHVPQDSVETTTSYLPPQSHGDQTPLETSESQVQQANDFSAGYYAQLYRPIADFDGRISPFTASGAAVKYGSLPVMPTQTGHAQEGINSFVLPSVGSTPLATPTPGAVPSSVSIPQQPLQLFRQPLGVLPPYPGYIPYSQYPLYVPPPHPLTHFMGNAVFPQPPSTGGMYPPVSSAVAPPAKYATNTYKPGANNGTQAHAGNPGAYGTYDSSPSVYTNNAVVASGTSVENDDISGSQYKETNVYIAGQQNEGSAVWISAPGRDISGLQPSSYYGLTLQGQHLAFAPAQAGHGTFGGIYHPGQTMAGAAVHPLLQPPQAIAGVGGEMVGPPANGYQQPQRAQMNWPNY
ncbi:GBF-interacting protein 1-like isoform X1 [Oryza brachyantha]|uniref:GBF-interacting protein 1-like isoform X1 n=1 Tax=Oryza brachyantha TaxID=4533 RepID=UPI000776287E|nr:GBF-interacting protein 1-like isoform X1 [Oryza brachyantha]